MCTIERPPECRENENENVCLVFLALASNVEGKAGRNVMVDTPCSKSACALLCVINNHPYIQITRPSPSDMGLIFHVKSQ